MTNENVERRVDVKRNTLDVVMKKKTTFLGRIMRRNKFILDTIGLERNKI